MKPGPPIKLFVYTLLVILSLAAVGLTLISPSQFTNLKLVYGGF
jgi:hypothetical protein